MGDELLAAPLEYVEYCELERSWPWVCEAETMGSAYVDAITPALGRLRGPASSCLDSVSVAGKQAVSRHDAEQLGETSMAGTDSGRGRWETVGGVSVHPLRLRGALASALLIAPRLLTTNFQGSQIGSPTRLPLLVLPRPRSPHSPLNSVLTHAGRQPT
jgi:hypothetical protein